MNVILDKNNYTEQSAKESAHNIINNQIIESKKTKAEIIELLQEASKELDTNETPEQKELAVLLALPEEHFAVLAPVFLSELQISLHQANNGLFAAQMLNATGINLDNVEEAVEKIKEIIDETAGSSLSSQKRNFLKQIISTSYNVLAETEGVAKKKILIPLEYCREGAKMPTYAHLTDSGMDVYALEDITIAPGETRLIPTGLKVAIPAGYELQVRPKSGRCLKTKLRVANTPGTIDAGYRDEIGVIIDNIEPFIKSAEMDETGRLYNVEFGSSYTIGAGEKFAQLVLCEIPKAVFYEVETVATVENDGRAGGFGSSGLK